MPDDATVWFPSKIDRWIAALMVVPPLGAALCLAIGLWRGQGPIAALPAALVTAIYLGLVLPMRYGISGSGIAGGELIIRFGLMRQRVPLAKVTSVRPTRSPLSSPALSLARIEVRWGQGLFEATMISPADRDGFLVLLAQRAGLKRDGDVLTR